MGQYEGERRDRKEVKVSRRAKWALAREHCEAPQTPEAQQVGA